jgi:hypothetical protein
MWTKTIVVAFVLRGLGVIGCSKPVERSEQAVGTAGMAKPSTAGTLTEAEARQLESTPWSMGTR